MGKSKVSYMNSTLVQQIGIVALLVIMRLVPHPANMTPIAAMALFGGAYFDKKYALVLPLVAMVISDYFLGFHASMPFVYGSILLTGVIGMSLRGKRSVQRVVLASFISSLLFFLITNFGFWLTDSLYPKTVSGQLQAYYYALPFFRNSLIGDMLYTGLFFISHKLYLMVNKSYVIVRKI
jgi:hypothetical protein